MSRTLVKGSGCNTGGIFLGKGQAYKKLYPSYTSGQIIMDELLKETFAEWKGLEVSHLPKIYNQFEFNPGVKETIKAVKDLGIKTVLLTNIPTELGKLFQNDFAFDYINGAILEVNDGVFTGKVLEFHNNKAVEAKKILEQAGINAGEAISIGDRKDDAEVFKMLKFGIAYNGDEEARKIAKYQISDFRELLNIIEENSQMG